MAIKDFIVPRWKHSNPQIRIQAIRSLNPDMLDVFKQVIEKDPDPLVRIETIRQLKDIDFLKQIMETDPDPDTRKAAVNKLNLCYANQIFSSNDPSLQSSLLVHITDEKILARIASEAQLPEVRLKAIDRIDNTQLLCQITENNCGLKPGKAIVNKISNPKHLEIISKNASNKKIKKYALKKLTDLWDNMDSVSPEKQMEWELEELCLSLEKIVATEKWSESYSLLNHLKKKWDQIDPDNTHPLRKRFNEFERKIEEQLDHIDRKQDTVFQMTELCKKLELLFENIQQSSIPSNTSDNLTYYKQQIQSIRDSWDNAELSVQDGIIPFSIYHNLSSRYSRSIEQLDRILSQRKTAYVTYKTSLEKLTKICNALEQLDSNSDDKEVLIHYNQHRNEWNNILKQMPCAPPAYLSDQYRKIDTLFAQKQKDLEDEIIEIKDNEEKRLIELCEIVEQARVAEIRAGLEKKVKSAQDEWRSSGKNAPQKKEELSSRFKKACKEFYTIQRDFWDKKSWEQWANLALKEELCEALELSIQNDSLQELAKKAREAQEKWRELGSVDRNKSETIWARFHANCDTIYKRCFEEKTKIYQELKEIMHDIDNDINWKDTTEKVKKIQESWNNIGVLPKSVEKDLRFSFQAMCNIFFERQREFYQKRDQDRKNNLARKKTICEQAEKLSHSTDWAETSRQLKSLQRKWKSIGPVPKNESDALWANFRKACNTFFQRLENELPKNLEKKEALCEKVEQILTQLDQSNAFDTLTEQILSLQQQWKQIGPVPQEMSQKVWDRFQTPCNSFFERKSDYLKQRKRQWEENQKQKEQLLEIAESMASSTDWKVTSEKFTDLQKKWQQIGSTPRKIERELWSRFQEANDHFFSQQIKHFESLDSEKKEKLKQKESICLRLEILAKLTISTSANFEYNKFIPIAEQLDMALKFKDEIFIPNDGSATRANALKRMKVIQEEWEFIGPISDRYDSSLLRRYQKAVEHLSSLVKRKE
jgi:hypothetical protein